MLETPPGVLFVLFPLKLSVVQSSRLCSLKKISLFHTLGPSCLEKAVSSCTSMERSFLDLVCLAHFVPTVEVLGKSRTVKIAVNLL